MQRSMTLLNAALLVLLAGCAAAPQPVEAPRPDTFPSLPQAVDSAEGVAPALVVPARYTVPEAAPGHLQVAARTAHGHRHEHAQASTVQRGPASWYAPRLHGRRTASGERYNRHALTAAHPNWPIPSYARVRNPANGREVIVRINDRGPFHRGHIIDVSHAAAQQLGILRGPRVVEVERLSDDGRHHGRRRRADAETPEHTGPLTFSNQPLPST